MVMFQRGALLKEAEKMKRLILLIYYLYSDNYIFEYLSYTKRDK